MSVNSLNKLNGVSARADHRRVEAKQSAANENLLLTFQQIIFLNLLLI